MRAKSKILNFAESKITEDDYAEHFKKYETITEVTRELLIDLIDKIFIDKIDSPCGNISKQHKHIRVLFKFANNTNKTRKKSGHKAVFA